MRLVHMPLAEFRGLVLIKAKMDPQRKIRALERVGESQIGGSIVGRIAAQDDEHVHLAATHVGDQVFQGLGLD